MKITAYKIDEEAMEILPSSQKRQWMDETPNQYAYRCLPLTIANSNGYVLLAPSDFLVIWNGGKDKRDLIPQIAYSKFNFVESLFGSGIFTLHTGYIFRTSKEYDLYVSGVPNNPIKNVYPLSGIVETWWMPFTFTMNYMLTEPGTYMFKKGDPLVFITPIPHQIGELKAEVVKLSDDPKLQQDFDLWKNDRNKMVHAIDMAEKTRQPYHNVDLTKPETTWEKTYYRGLDKSGNKISGHSTRKRFPKFK